MALICLCKSAVVAMLAAVEAGAYCAPRAGDVPAPRTHARHPAAARHLPVRSAAAEHGQQRTVSRVLPRPVPRILCTKLLC